MNNYLKTKPLESEYPTLFNGISNAINELEYLTTSLKLLQIKAEQQYISSQELNEAVVHLKTAN